MIDNEGKLQRKNLRIFILGQVSIKYRQYSIYFIIRSQSIQNMTESRSKSPQNLLKRSQILASPKNSSSKMYLPSRYAQERKTDKLGFQDILNSIEAKTGGQNVKSKAEMSPQMKNGGAKKQIVQQVRLKTSKFVTRPMKREKLDDQQFKQIFLNPREDALEELKKKSSLEQNTKTISKQYEKLLKISKSQGINFNLCEDKTSQSELKKQTYTEAIQLLQEGLNLQVMTESNQTDFYDNHIVMQPPDSPSNQNQVGSTSGSIYAPSIPSNCKSYKSANIKELLMRARAGMSNEDVEKQAHLSHILGEAYSAKRMYSEALKFHRRFLGLAKSMEDYVGMSLGANRVAISYYNCNDYERSILFHNQNLKLSSNENCFVGFYNIGICYRKLNKMNDALEYFESALSWARERGQQQSECIALGQIGVTYQHCQDYKESIKYFQKSNQICKKIKKQDLKLHNLRYILRICSINESSQSKEITDLVEESFLLAHNTGKLHLLDIFRCNMGIVRGIKNFNQDLKQFGEAVDVQECF